MDALAPGSDEGRDKLRKASGSCLVNIDPEIPESGNRAGFACHPGICREANQEK